MGAVERIDEVLEHETVRVERRKPSYRFLLGFSLFVLTTATLFIRPGEIFPATESWPIFQVLILSTLAVAHPELIEQLRLEQLVRFPVLLCVLGMTVSIALSLVMQGDFYNARYGAFDYGKVAAYFFLLVALVNTLPRLRLFLGITIILILIMAVVAILSKYHIVHLYGAQTEIVRGDGGWNEATQSGTIFDQLQGWGIFSDPNDFALILVLAIIGALYFITESQSLLPRLLWCVPLATLMFAFALTKSRGGLLSLLAGLGIWMVSRFGMKRAIVLGIFVMPLLLAMVAGRQTNIDIGDANDTAQSRIRLWRDGIGFIKSSPIWGVGYNTYGLRTDNVAHNSYLHCYAELGFIGGTFFLGLFVLPIMGVCSPRTQKRFQRVGDFLMPPAEGLKAEEIPFDYLGPELAHLRSVILAIGVAYAVGLFSLSRSYACSTYLMLGMVVSLSMLIAAKNPGAVARLSTRMTLMLISASVFWLGFLVVFVKVMVKAAGGGH
jgi:O-antigen ligase